MNIVINLSVLYKNLGISDQLFNSLNSMIKEIENSDPEIKKKIFNNCKSNADVLYYIYAECCERQT